MSTYLDNSRLVQVITLVAFKVSAIFVIWSNIKLLLPSQAIISMLSSQQPRWRWEKVSGACQELGRQEISKETLSATFFSLSGYFLHCGRESGKHQQTPAGEQRGHLLTITDQHNEGEQGWLVSMT